MPIPTMTIAADDPLIVRSGTSLQVAARGALASCFNASDAAIDFAWENTAATPLPCSRDTSPQLLALDVPSTSAREDRRLL